MPLKRFLKHSLSANFYSESYNLLQRQKNSIRGQDKPQHSIIDEQKRMIEQQANQPQGSQLHFTSQNDSPDKVHPSSGSKEDKNKLNTTQALNVDEPSRQDTKQKWTHFQNLRFLVLLKQYQNQIRQTRSYVFFLFEKFIVDKNLQKIQKKYNNLIQQHNSINQAIQYLKNKHLFADWEIQRELKNLKQYEKQHQIKVQHYFSYKTIQPIKQRANEVQNLLKQIQQESVNNVTFEIPTELGDLSDLIFLTNTDSKIIQAQNSSNKNWIKMKKATINFKPTVNDAKLNFTNRFPPQSCISTQKASQTFHQVMNEFFVGYINNKMAQIHILGQINELKFTKSEKQAAQSQQKWTDYQKFRFILFVSLYQQEFQLKTSKNVFYISSFMSECIGTRTKHQCFKHWQNITGQYETFESMIDDYLKRLNITHEQFQEEKIKHFWICVKTLVIFQLDKTKRHRIANFQNRRDDLISLITKPNKFHQTKETKNSINQNQNVSMDLERDSSKTSNLSLMSEWNKLPSEYENVSQNQQSNQEQNQIIISNNPPNTQDKMGFKSLQNQQFQHGSNYIQEISDIIQERKKEQLGYFGSVKWQEDQRKKVANQPFDVLKNHKQFQLLSKTKMIRKERNCNKSNKPQRERNCNKSNKPERERNCNKNNKPERERNCNKNNKPERERNCNKSNKPERERNIKLERRADQVFQQGIQINQILLGALSKLNQYSSKYNQAPLTFKYYQFQFVKIRQQ